MTKRQFVSHRKADWIKFARLVEHSERRGLRRGTVQDFSRLFRELAHDLALVRSRGWGEGLETYLNDLIARAHNRFYRSPPGKTARFLEFLAEGYPRVFRRNVRYFWIAAAVLFLPMLLCGALVAINPDAASRVMTAAQLQQMEAMYSQEFESVEQIQFVEERATMGGFYVYHNVGIALRAFGAGLFFGVVTLYVLFSNGVHIGTIAGYLISQGYGNTFLSFIISHGAFELTAIAVAGGAGLMLGDAILHPGQRSRVESLIVQGREAVQIAGGAAVMLMIAALIEAFWSPAAFPAELKFVVGGMLWLMVTLYLSIVGREHVYESEILLDSELEATA